MSRPRPPTTRRALPARRKAALIATALALVIGHVLPAAAQQAPELRGEVTEAELREELLRRQRILAPAYEPASPGPTPSARPGTTASIFDPAEDAATPTDPFAAAPLPAARPPSTARARAEALRPSPTARERTEAATAAAGARPESAAKRLDQETTGGTERVESIEFDDDRRIDEGAQRVEAIENLDRQPEENPYAPVGLRLGTFDVRPSIEQGITATTNASGSSGGASGVLSETTLRLNATSDWSRHSATLDAYGIFRRSLSGGEAEEFEGGIDAAAELELGNDWRARGEIGYAARPESASSAVDLGPTLERPLRQTFDASAGLHKDIGKARLGVTGSLVNDRYGDAELLTGAVVPQDDRNSTLYSVALRGGYEISPALTPFVEVELGRRDTEHALDAAGYARSADRLGIRAGAEIDLGEKLSGEFAAGWLREAFDDERLEAISGASVNAALNWSPERGTTVRLSGTTSVEGTTTAGSSGSMLYQGRLSVERQMRANLTGTALLGADWRDYAGSGEHDTTLIAEAGLTLWLNRYAGLTGRARHEMLKSSLPDRDSETSSIFLGLKLQR